MDLESAKQQLGPVFKKYRYLLLAVLLGVFLMLLPDPAGKPQVQSQPVQKEEKDLEGELSNILSQIAGVGSAQVLLTEDSGQETIYQMDANQSSCSTVTVTDGNRQETGLIRQVQPPVYRGAVVVCQGADSPGVRLSVVEAVSSVTGLSSHRITVLKMK